MKNSLLLLCSVYYFGLEVILFMLVLALWQELEMDSDAWKTQQLNVGKVLHYQKFNRLILMDLLPYFYMYY